MALGSVGHAGASEKSVRVDGHKIANGQDIAIGHRVLEIIGVNVAGVVAIYTGNVGGIEGGRERRRDGAITDCGRTVQIVHIALVVDRGGGAGNGCWEDGRREDEGSQKSEREARPDAGHDRVLLVGFVPPGR